MNTIAASAVVTGARHLRAARNGQDAAATIVDGERAVAVVCDGCSAGASSEVGARLGAMWFARAIATRLGRGEPPSDPALWAAARAELALELRRLAGGDAIDLAVLRACFLFTIVAVAVTREAAAVWALGDGAYAVDGATRTLGPFDDNEPPYVAYDLLGAARGAHFEVLPADTRTVVIATDGAGDLAAALGGDGDLARFGGARFVEHPDALRRELARLARADERIAWDERRIVRAPAPLQDDCAIAVVRRAVEPAS
ncbi:MAG TPA: protein phosphatase 2C domain-containing protein [Kofleriaceae bacterium]|jgi:hypothetical protein|nr:protein phosphatase 2C domain-containing protein [Kofleriaceae bacterium]